MTRILIVDDGLFIRQSIRRMLEGLDFEVVGEAENGEEAFTKYKMLSPDLVTLDVMMPKQNGIETLRQILAYDSNAKVVMVSASDQAEIIKDALRFGAKSFLLKPFTSDMLLKILQHVIDNEI